MQWTTTLDSVHILDQECITLAAQEERLVKQRFKTGPGLPTPPFNRHREFSISFQVFEEKKSGSRLASIFSLEAICPNNLLTHTNIEHSRLA